jgi:hypothetical protein
MCADESGPESFEEIFRQVAREMSRSVERAAGGLEELAEALGVEPERAHEWVDGARSWLRGRADQVFEDAAKATAAPPEDPLRHAGPHPLDLPTEEQGLALAALDSGRWTVEPGSDALAVHGEGPGPSDAMGLLRGLRARDWVSLDGGLTLVGRHALGRWLDSHS